MHNALRKLSERGVLTKSHTRLIYILRCVSMRQELFEFCNPKVIGETWFTDFFRALFLACIEPIHIPIPIHQKATKLILVLASTELPNNMTV